MDNQTISLTGTYINPDKVSIENKKVIDISVSLADISSSNYTSSVRLNYAATEIQLYSSSSKSTYYTYYVPVYKEQINYNTWKTTINKSFQELGTS